MFESFESQRGNRGFRKSLKWNDAFSHCTMCLSEAILKPWSCKRRFPFHVQPVSQQKAWQFGTGNYTIKKLLLFFLFKMKTPTQLLYDQA